MAGRVKIWQRKSKETKEREREKEEKLLSGLIERLRCK